MTNCKHERLDYRWSRGALARCRDCGLVEDGGEWNDPVQQYLRLVNSDDALHQDGAKHMRRYLDLAREKDGIPYPK